ncbi:MAG: ribonuclease HII [Flavobacteriales bacterium]|nr:ribonuclease HII [Flavobacteriales bacterium]
MSKLLKRFEKGLIECGCDEAGRGCLAGSVFAGAVILPDDFDHPLLNDSKKLTASARDQLRPIIETHAVAWAVGVVTPEEIDQINILNASFLAMHRAIDQLSEKPELLLIDGNRFKPYGQTNHVCIIKGDGKYRSIAAASILAKTHRDEYMMRLHEKFPDYHWQDNKGYPTTAHRQALAEHGPTPFHRRSFSLNSKQTVLPL